MTLSQKSYYPALTGLRALAAYMVFLCHANPFTNNGWQSSLYSFTNELHVGVSLFFVLSGFLIYTRYSEKPQSTSDWFVKYFRNRIARIYPLYFVVLITLIAVSLLQSSKISDGLIFNYLINFTLMQGFFNELKFTGIMQAWSLTVEECFYLCIPLILLWKKKYSIFVLPLLLFISGILLVFILSPLHFYGLFADLHFMMEFTFFGRCFEFFAGIVLAIYLKRKTLTENSSSKTYYTYLGLTGLLLLIAAIAFFADASRSGLNHPAGSFINNFLVPLAAVVFFLGLIREDNYLKRFLSTPALQVLGKSSYAFYLIHAGYFYEMMYYHISKNTLIIFVVMNVIAIALYYGIEKPLNEKWRVKVN